MTAPSGNGVAQAHLKGPDGSYWDLGTLGGSASWAYGINESSLVVGASVTATWKTHAFYATWNGAYPGRLQDLGALAGGYSEARAVNNSGQIVGDSSVASGYFHAFVVTGGVMYDLGTMGGNSSYALSTRQLRDDRRVRSYPR